VKRKPESVNSRNPDTADILQDLAHAAPGGPTMRPGWLAAWQAAFAARAGVEIIPFGTCGALAVTRVSGPKGLRLLSSPTNGHARYAIVKIPPEGADALVPVLRSRAGWDALRLQGVYGADAQAITRAFEKAGFKVAIERRFTSLLRLSGPDSPPLPVSSGKTRRRRDRQERAFAETGALAWQDSVGADAPAALEEFMRGEARSWKAETGEPLSATPQIAGFYRALARGGDPTFRVTLLSRDGITVAGLICVDAGAERAALKIFYDAALARHSPGAMVLRRAAAQADADAGVSCLDLYSDWSQYHGLANGRRDLCDLTIWNRTTRAFVLRTARDAAHHARARISPPKA
jgi:CelD/BcsL family acetyltransferase involved in cellulose biosynthesis